MGLFLGFVIAIMVMVQPKQVVLAVDGKEKTWTTRQYLTPMFLKKVSGKYGFDVGKLEYVKGNKFLSNGTKVVVNTEKELKVVFKGKERVYKTYKNRLDEFLKAINEKENKDGTKGSILSLDYKGKEKEVELKGLKELKLVEYKEEKTQKESIDKLKVKYEDSGSLDKGTTKVKSKGKNGKYLDEVTKIYVDGKLQETKTKKLKTLVKRQDKVVLRGTKEPAVKYQGGTTVKSSTKATSGQYSLATFMQMGVVNWGGYKYTYYSQSVLPGGGLNIPGRHVSAAGYVCDKDGYIVLASSAPKGTVFPTPFGASGKVYDRGVSGNHLDVYIR